MINMIKADFYRVFKGFVIYIGFAIMLILIGVSIYGVQPGSIGTVSVSVGSESYSTPLDDMTYEEMQDFKLSEYREMILKSEGFELDRELLAQNLNLYYVFIFVVALAVAVDFSNGSIKNTLSSAISRKKYFVSKTAFIAAVCLLFFIANTYIIYFSNLIFNGKNFTSSLGTVTKISLMQLPPILALISILSGLSFLVKKTSVFNTVVIPLIIVFQLMISFVIKLFNINEKLMNYEMQIMIEKLAYDPSGSYIIHSYIFCAVIIVVFNLIGYLSFRKAEIK